MLSIEEVGRTASRISKEHGFYRDKDELHFPTQISLFHSEISEAFEEYRSGHDLNETYYEGSDQSPHGIPTELADVIIRILGYCHVMDIDIVSAIRDKLSYNERRTYRHGGKVC